MVRFPSPVAVILFTFGFCSALRLFSVSTWSDIHFCTKDAELEKVMENEEVKNRILKVRFWRCKRPTSIFRGPEPVRWCRETILVNIWPKLVKS
jgi:hypothetical protein